MTVADFILSHINYGFTGFEDVIRNVINFPDIIFYYEYFEENQGFHHTEWRGEVSCSGECNKDAYLILEGKAFSIEVSEKDIIKAGIEKTSSKAEKKYTICIEGKYFKIYLIHIVNFLHLLGGV